MRKLFLLIAAAIMAVGAMAQTKITTSWDLTDKPVPGSVTYLNGKVEKFAKLGLPEGTSKTIKATKANGEKVKIAAKDINYITLHHPKAPHKDVVIYCIKLDERIASKKVTHRWCLKGEDHVWCEIYLGYDYFKFDRRDGEFWTILKSANGMPREPLDLYRHRQKPGAFIWYPLPRKNFDIIFEDFPKLYRKVKQTKTKDLPSQEALMELLDEAYTEKYLK